MYILQSVIDTVLSRNCVRALSEKMFRIILAKLEQKARCLSFMQNSEMPHVTAICYQFLILHVKYEALIPR